jgi:hypothetical protein
VTGIDPSHPACAALTRDGYGAREVVMTIIIGIPPLIAPGDPAEAIRVLLTLIEPIAMAVAAACGAGLLFQLGLGLGIKLTQRALRPA